MGIPVVGPSHARLQEKAAPAGAGAVKESLGTIVRELDASRAILLHGLAEPFEVLEVLHTGRLGEGPEMRKIGSFIPNLAKLGIVAAYPSAGAVP